ncbi:hypothetical protein ACJQWK_08379 [Exserohilum turcicum]
MLHGVHDAHPRTTTVRQGGGLGRARQDREKRKGGRNRQTDRQTHPHPHMDCPTLPRTHAHALDNDVDVDVSGPLASPLSSSARQPASPPARHPPAPPPPFDATPSALVVSSPLLSGRVGSGLAWAPLLLDMSSPLLSQRPPAGAHTCSAPQESGVGAGGCRNRSAVSSAVAAEPPSPIHVAHARHVSTPTPCIHTPSHADSYMDMYCTQYVRT